MKAFMFRWRGWLFIPSAFLMLYLAKPTLLSLLVGFGIVCLGEALRIWAVGFTGTTTRDSELEAPRLITAGPYSYIRNPLYLGNLISWLGYCAACSGDADLINRVIIFGGVIISYIIIYGNIIPYEESFLKEKFPEDFNRYEKQVPRLFPHFKPYSNSYGKYDPKVILTAEIHTIIMLVAVGGVIVLRYMDILRF